MTRRYQLLVLAVSLVAALAAVACEADHNPAAPTSVPAAVTSDDGAFDTLPGAGTAVGAVARNGAVDVKGVIQGVDLNSHTFDLAARNGRDVTVRVTQKTVFAAGPNPRARVTFRSLKAGMAVDVVGRIERDVLVARSVVVLKARPTA